ncbi:VOC family protein [Marinobacterium aestuariivivens]|uniref:VOC family protein n=1 Tax=Marinobacterium aestuariivivens TaxID=1698799 RepID=A0ABW2A0J7_9GAMM
MGNGYSHIGVSTHNMEATIEFYERVLGFKRVVDNLTRINEGGTLRQVYFDVGDAQYIVFMEPKAVEGISDDYDTGINGALGLPGGMYHLAFRVRTLDALESRRQQLEARSIEVSPIIDLGHASSIFFTDPNRLQLELSCQTRPFDESDLHQESTARLAR